MPAYPILPSLSRAPAFETSRSIEDGTLADPMESGYVATRPRFTRLRRKHGVSWKFLNAEDLRALDKFETSVVFGKAGAFWLPNLLPNSSFEQDGDGGVFGWIPGEVDGWAITSTATAYDGTAALLISGSANSVSLESGNALAVLAGETYQVSAAVSASGDVGIAFFLDLTYGDGSTASPVITLVSASTIGYVLVSGTLTVPTIAGSPVNAMAVPRFSVSGNNAVVLLDAVGLALTSTPQPYGRTIGSAPLARAVRFTKTLDVKDAGWVNGAKAYNVTAEVTEL